MSNLFPCARPPSESPLGLLVSAYISALVTGGRHVACAAWFSTPSRSAVRPTRASRRYSDLQINCRARARMANLIPAGRLLVRDNLTVQIRSWRNCLVGQGVRIRQIAIANMKPGMPAARDPIGRRSPRRAPRAGDGRWGVPQTSLRTGSRRFEPMNSKSTKNNKSSPSHFYSACQVCTAKWFSQDPLSRCPRCGCGALYHDRMDPPWGRNGRKPLGSREDADRSDVDG
jgi:hypothetical protein